MFGLTVKPLLCSSWVAAAWVWPMTFGTLVPPSETFRVTMVLGATLVPAAGDWLTTVFCGSELCTCFTL